MAAILGVQTIDSAFIFLTNVHPGLGYGTVAPIGSFGAAANGGGVFYKFGPLNTNYSRLITLDEGFVNNGNSFGTDAVIGTTDIFDLAFITDTNEWARLLTTGEFGFGTSTPTERVTIANGNLLGSNAGGFMVMCDNSNTYLNLNYDTIGGIKLQSEGDLRIQNTWTANPSVHPSIIILDKVEGAGTIVGKIHLRVDRNTSGSAITFGQADLTPARTIFLDTDNNYSGFNYDTPTATIHAVGKDATSGNYTLKIETNAFANLFSVRNDGLISMPLLQTGNAGLSSGDLYVDTAANILLNGDLIVGRKV